MPLGLLVFIPDQLSISKIRALVMGHKVNRHLIMKRSILLLILPDTSFHDHIHVIFDFALLIDLLACFHLLKSALVINFYSLF